MNLRPGWINRQFSRVNAEVAQWPQSMKDAAGFTDPDPRDAEITRLARDAVQGSIVPYLRRQWDWSRRTFGPGKRTQGNIAHIRKELAEIEAKPEDLSEWLDVAILAMDGYWRHGGTPETFMADLLAKQQRNFARTWPTPTSEDEAVEHDRSLDNEKGK